MYYFKQNDTYIASTTLPVRNRDKYTIITQQEYEEYMATIELNEEEAQENVSN